MQFIQASTHPHAFNKKTKKLSLEKTVLIIWSQISKKGAYWPRKFIYKKNSWNLKLNVSYNELQISRIFFLQNIFLNKVSNFLINLRPHNSNNLFYTFIVVFLLKSPGCLETWVNCNTIFKTPKTYPNSLGCDKINIHLGVTLPTKSCWTFLDNSPFLCVTKTSRIVFLVTFFNPSCLWHGFNFFCEKVSTNKYLTLWLLCFGETCFFDFINLFL